MPNEAEAYRLLIGEVNELAAISRGIGERLAARHGLTVARWQVMSVVSEEDATVPGIASRLGLARQSVQRVVDILVTDGLALKRANPQHRSSPLVTLTARGSEILVRLADDYDDELARLLSARHVQRRELLAARRTVRSLLALLRAQDR
ncbi:hypothetical protein GCM10023169_27840 [Georgenia halophila]|uniref:HTH marR-type domain-containing protein n=1 Tax=Georgenia halophila TaxID=620889 RepID=A0ABP8LDJ2_9MICO